MSFYRRRLPHWHPDNKDLFITWTLSGAISRKLYLPPKELTHGEEFLTIDRLLDGASQGPKWLRNPEIARLVVTALHHSAKELRHYELHAYVVMPNHVHILISPATPPRFFMHTIKRHTALQANRSLGRTGAPFWQHEYYDHWIRNQDEFEKTRRYIERNPVAAGLSPTPEAYPWSSASKMGSAQECERVS